MRLAPLIAVFMAFVLAGSSDAVEPLVVDLWPGRAPDENSDVGPERLVMSPAAGRKDLEVTEPTRMITDVSKPTLTIHRPAKEKDTGTAMLICPGGGYWNLFWQLEGEEVAAWLNSIGITGIILKYRVPRRPDEIKGEPARRPLQDAQRAVSLVRSKAKEWDIDPNHIGIGGFSAGGHLALAVATNFDLSTLFFLAAAIADIWVAPFEQFGLHLDLKSLLVIYYGIALPLDFIDRLIHHARKDQFRAECQRLLRRAHHFRLK